MATYRYLSFDPLPLPFERNYFGGEVGSRLRPGDSVEIFLKLDDTRPTSVLVETISRPADAVGVVSIDADGVITLDPAPENIDQ